MIYQTIGSGKNIQYDIPQNDLDRMIIQDKNWMQKDKYCKNIKKKKMILNLYIF